MRSNVPERPSFRDHRFFLALLIVNVVLGRIAMRLYGEQFVILQHAISDLGATVTRGGLPNRRAPWLFLFQMTVSALMCLRYARRLAGHSGGTKDHRVRLIRLCAAGFFLMPAPHNIRVMHTVHMFGGGFIFFSLWVLTMIYLSEARRSGRVATFWVGMIVLQATVLSYALFFAVDHELKQVAQGIGLTGLLAVLIWSTQLLAREQPVTQDSDEAARQDSTAST